MEKARRGEFLKQRFKAIGGVAYVPTGKPKPYRHTFTERPIQMAWPQIIPDTKRAPGWMRVPDAKPVPVPQPKRNAGASPLAKIAKQSGRKLVRAYRNAEAFAASRKRR
jgi:hypothetical protein